MWRHTSLRDVAFLTVIPDASAEIEGLIAQVPDNDWAALDLREHAYSRAAIARETLTIDSPRDVAVQIYQTRTDQDAAPSTRHPILRSYLDVVVQGYLRVFGENGAARFFETTDGWDAPILDDRAAPQYPRHQRLTAQETALVDRLLAAHM